MNSRFVFKSFFGVADHRRRVSFQFRVSEEVEGCDGAANRRKYKPEICDVKAHKGDRVKVHYRGQLTDGTVFDSSYERGDPFEFVLGSGQVIQGWDQGILGMCLKEKRKLKIPAKLGYGEQGSPPTIPGGATLIFDTELMEVSADKSEEGVSDLPDGFDDEEEDVDDSDL